MKQKNQPTPDALAAFQRLGERLLKARKLRGWSSQDTATRCGINRNTLRTLEQGKMVNSGVLLKVLSQYHMLHELELLAQPDNDKLGQALSNHTPQRTPDLDNNF